jgi:hypothetical protein
LAGLVVFSIHLAVHRIYQVDEAQNLYMAMIVGRKAWNSFHTTAPLLVMGPLAWLGRSADASAPFFLSGRMVFLGVFWINLLLIALNLGADLRRRSGLLLLVIAATLAPLWDYGFEIRHDNLILMGLLVCWGVIRTPGLGRTWAYGVVGFVLAVLQFIAFKPFLYGIPLTLAILIFPPPWFKAPRWRLALSWVLGAACGVLLVRGGYALAGAWEVCLEGFRLLVSISKGADRFPPWDGLRRLTVQTPLLLAGSAGAALIWAGTYRREGRKALGWETGLPELVLAVGSLAVFAINPTPFPYNLVLVAPFLLLTLRPWLREGLEAGGIQPSLRPWLIGLVLFTHAVPFLSATVRHLDWTNARQVQLMTTAEALTDPVADRVYDGVGLVPTRASIGYRWYLHSLNIAHFYDGTWLSVRQMLARNPAAVILTNYRTDWLGGEDRDYVAAHYLPLTDDLWVLGGRLPDGGGEYECLHPGRYQIITMKGGRRDSAPAQVDGRPVEGHPLPLERGRHAIATPPGTYPVVVWVGPRLGAVPSLQAGDHRRLFVNWY